MQLPDMDLLPALDALLRTGSVAGAAAELHVSASAMSRTLGRLRRVVGDPLLVPSGRALAPTARARDLAPRVEEALARARAVLAPPGPTDLATLQRQFVIRGADAAAMMLVSGLTAAAAREAPGVRFRLIPEGDEDPADLRDRVDLDVGALPALPPDVASRPLAALRFEALARPSAPIGDDGLTLDDFVALPHVTVSRRGRAHSVVDDRLADLGRSREVLATVPAIGAACLLASRLDVLALIPTGPAAEMAEAMALRRFTIPIDLPPVEIGMAWHRRHDTDPAHRWLRDTVASLGG